MFKVGPFLLFPVFITLASAYAYEFSFSDFSSMKCGYGDRGSLTAICANAVPSFFRLTSYRFDHLDETLKCLNCNLTTLYPFVFDLQGNQILHLYINNSQISTIRPKAFVGLIFLKNLYLSNNNVSSVLAETFNGIKKLEMLYFDNNQITTLYDNAFLELVQLKYLDLSSNKIVIIQPKAFDGLKSILRINLADNKISHISSVFNNLITLKALKLDDNKITNLNETDLVNVTSLDEISFRNNSLSNLEPFSLSEMSNMQRLDLSYNKISVLSEGLFVNLRKLGKLSLDHNAIREVLPGQFNRLVSLQILDMSHNKLTEYLGVVYAGLPDLEVLDLSDNLITNMNLYSLFPLNSLHTLVLAGNLLTDIDYVALLHKAPSLRYLDLQRNTWPCDLKEEMETYFEEESFKFWFSPVCTNTTSHDNKLVPVEKLSDMITTSSSLTYEIIVFCLIALVVVLLAASFAVQYRFLKYINYNPLLNRKASFLIQSTDGEPNA